MVRARSILRVGILMVAVLAMWGGALVQADEGGAAAGLRLSVSADRVATGDAVALRAAATSEPPAFYQWDVDGDGDIDVVSGTAAVDVAFSDDGIYSVRVAMIDAAGQEIESEAVSISVSNRAPDAEIAAPVGMLRAGVAVPFSGLAGDADGDIARWSWTFGDGTSSAEEQPSHVYASAGTYSVQLVVMDDDGAASPAPTLEIVVEDAPPAASFATHESESAPLVVVFVDTTTGSLRESIASVAWDFGDGTYSSGAPSRTATYVHEYFQPGRYSVTLYVIDRLGTLSTSSQQVWISG